MRIKETLFLAVFFCALFIVFGCIEKPRDFNDYIDLDGDGKGDFIFGKYGQAHWNHVDYDLVARFSKEAAKNEPRLIWRFKNSPDKIEFTDMDNDGDRDLVFSTYGDSHWVYSHQYYDTYVAKNDGSGHFGNPELIHRQKKKP